MEKAQISLDLIRIKNKLTELKQNTRLIIQEIENIEIQIDRIISNEDTDHGEETSFTNFTCNKTRGTNG